MVEVLPNVLANHHRRTPGPEPRLERTPTCQVEVFSIGRHPPLPTLRTGTDSDLQTNTHDHTLACSPGSQLSSVENVERPLRLFLEQVIEPLVDGRPACYQRYDWPTESLAEWHMVDPAPLIIIEGVSSARREWSRHLSYVIWIETSRELRLQRAVERDGPDAMDDWEFWMAEEDAHYQRDPTRERSDAVIDGATGQALPSE